MEGTARQGWRKIALLSVAFAGFGFAAVPAAALDFSFGDDDLGWGNWGQVNFTWNTRLTAGVQMRTERRDYRLVDKQNVPANQNVFEYPGVPGAFDICEGLPPEVLATGPGVGNVSDCTTQLGDPRPGLSLVNAPGGYNINGDDGNLNYDRGDITYANFQVRSELTAFWNDFTFKVSGIGYYDPVNNDFDTHLADRPILEYRNRKFAGLPPPTPPEPTPVGFTVPIDRSSAVQRQDDEEDRLGEQLRLLEAFVAYDFDIAGRKLRIAVGDQRMRWGESTFMIFNNLARINPPSAELYDRPGTEVRDAFIPVGMVTASMNVTTNFNVEAFYQYDWEPVEPSVRGSFLSVSDVAGGGEGPTPIYLGMGNVPEAPLAPDLSEPTVFQQEAGGLFRAGGIAGTQTAGTRTIHLEDEAFGYPGDGGQFGLRLDYYADWLNGGTELSLYGMNIHSRLPFYSMFAAETNCTTTGNLRIAGGATSIGEILQDCRSFEDSAFSGDPSAPLGFDPQLLFAEGNYRVDTARGFLDYPEDIKVFGLSGTTQAGDWSLAGELAYSPNQPAQIAVTDVAYAAAQPAFPEWAITRDMDQVILDGGSGAGSFQNPQGTMDGSTLIPSRRMSVPDYISQYRCPANVNLAELYGQYGVSGSNTDVINAATAGNLGGLAARSDLMRELECSMAIQGGDYIRGYERLKVGQASMTGIRVFGSSHPISSSINSDQIIFVGEVAAYKAFDMPGLNELQFQGSGASQTHYSQGVADFNSEQHGYQCIVSEGCTYTDDEGDTVEVPQNERVPIEHVTEACGISDCLRGVGPADRINYERADEDIFADDFAMGYRMRLTADYNNGPFGWSWTPGFTFYHDVHGTSISPGQDFVEDRKRLTLHTNILFTNNFSGNFQYRFYWGAGDRNLLLDRDYAELSLSYAF